MEMELQQEVHQEQTLRERLRYNFYLIPLTLFAVAGGLVGTYAVTRPQLLPPIYQVRTAQTSAIPPIACPGQTIAYTATITVRGAPAQVAIVETVWSKKLNKTVIFDLEPRWAAYTKPVNLTRSFEYIVPLIGPGEYELRTVAQEFGLNASGYAVDFAVPDTCGMKP